MINICGTDPIDDIFYRYKRQKAIVVSNKNTTIFTNINEISKNLERDPKLLINFLKKYFGTNMIYKNNTLITTKTITSLEYDDAINKFIQLNILCNKCNLPETILSIGKNKTILSCKCCSNIQIL